MGDIDMRRMEGEEGGYTGSVRVYLVCVVRVWASLYLLQ